MHRAMKLLVSLAMLMSLCGCESEPLPASATTVRFDFHSSFLINLHHFLYDAARHPAGMDLTHWTAAPTPEELAVLRDAVAYYAAHYGTHDLLFDDELRDIKHSLAQADDERQNTRGLALPPALAEALDRVAPVYARCLWQAQNRLNLDWIARVEVLETRYGSDIQPRLERVFGSRFPALIRDDVVVNTGKLQGAYTDAPPPHTVMPSGRSDYDDLAALEMIWHEAAHTGPSGSLEALIETEARAIHRAIQDNLWHAALFYAVGVQVQQVLKLGSGIEYLPYAEKKGLYARAWPQFIPLLGTDWLAWNDGQGTMQAAVKAMVAKLGPESAKP